MMIKLLDRPTETREMPPLPGDAGLRPIVNKRLFGALLRTLRKDPDRVGCGFDRGQAFCDALLTRAGLRMSERTLYDIEKGQQEATFSEVVAFVIALKPEGGIHYFSPALPPDTAVQFMRLNCLPR